MGAGARTPTDSRLGRVLAILALACAAVLVSPGFFDEGAVSMHGDMARYLMNGVFIADFIREPRFTWDGVLGYAEHYFARYPALSLGHHPPLLPVLLAPFYLVFGVSVSSARMVLAACFLLSTWLTYSIGRRQYGGGVGGWAALLFAVHPFLVGNSQIVLSEIPALTCVLAAWAALLRFRDEGRFSDYLCFVGLAVAGLGVKQLTGFVWPAYVVILLLDCRSRFTDRRVAITTGVGAVLAVGLAVATLLLSPYNVEVVRNVMRDSLGLRFWHEIAAPVLEHHLRSHLAVAVGLVLAVWRRDRRMGLPLAWVLSVLVGVTFITGPHDVIRYAVYAIPAYCLMAASVATPGASRGGALLASLLLGGSVAVQVPIAAAERPVGGRGYEEAAKAVLEDGAAPTVLYSASVDTGYFVFFVRKHDAARRLIVLRSDKLLTTSFMQNLDSDDRIHSPDEVYPILDRFGTKYVVVEDRESGSPPLDWLRDEVKGPRFREHRRIPIESRDRRLEGVDLIVYEYLAAKPADPNAQLDMGLPLVGRDLRVRLGDLLPAAPAE
jgi:hypothetical protein